MHPFDEMKAYVRFDEEDERNLIRLWPFVEPQLHRVSDVFYSRIRAFPDAARVLRDDAQTERLKGTLRVWTRELLKGPWDDAYYERHRRIGQVHVTVALPHRFMFTAMTVVRDELCQMAEEAGLGERICRSIGRITTLDLAVMCGTFMDAHERRELEILQHLLVSHLPVAVLVVDSHGNVSTSTEPAFRLCGDGPVIGRPWARAVPPSLLAAGDLERQVARALSTGHAVCLPRLDATFDGAVRSFRVDVVPFQHDVAAFLLHVEELTATVEAEARAQRSEALARLGALSAAVAHELRNPLAGISGALQVLTRSLDTPDPRRAIMGQVLDQVRRMDVLVNDLLAFARPRAPSPAVTRLETVAADVARLLHQGHPKLDVRVEGNGHAWCDPDHVHRALLNLGTNAGQATDHAGAIRFLVADGRVEVLDDGPGVPGDLRQRIFEPFFTTRTQGTGLGLAISRQSAEAMGGALTLIDAPGGARFVLTLPRPATGADPRA